MPEWRDFDGDHLLAEPVANPPYDDLLAFRVLGTAEVHLNAEQVRQVAAYLNTFAPPLPRPAAKPECATGPTVAALLWIAAVLAAVFVAGGMILN